jgi:hypothetical protein
MEEPRGKTSQGMGRQTQYMFSSPKTVGEFVWMPASRLQLLSVQMMLGVNLEASMTLQPLNRSSQNW